MTNIHRPALKAIDHLVMTVADIDRTVAFYVDVLGMRAEVFHPADGSVRTALVFGHQKINLHLSGQAFAPHAAAPQVGSCDLCFLSDTPLGEWQRFLDDKGIAIIDGPIARTGATGPLKSIYLRDPDGNLIEISNTI